MSRCSTCPADPCQDWRPSCSGIRDEEFAENYRKAMRGEDVSRYMRKLERAIKKERDLQNA